MTWNKAVEAMVESEVAVQLPGWPEDCFVYVEAEDGEYWPCWQDGDNFDLTPAMKTSKKWEIAEGAIIPPPKGSNVGLRPSAETSQ